MGWTVYLSGEIHTGWREEIRQGLEAKGVAAPIVTVEIL